MKKRYFTLLLLAVFAVGGAWAQSLGDILQKIGGSASDSGLGTILNNVLGSSKITVEDINGKWGYVEPAVEFKSSNLLQKAGGAAVSTAIVNKIKPYYEKAGIEKLKLTVESDGSFKMSTGKITLSGTITQGEEDGTLIFQFKAAGKINLGKITSYASKTATGQLKITFDASKLITIVNGIAKISNNSTVQAVSSVLNSYEGLTVGFVMKKE